MNKENYGFRMDNTDGYTQDQIDELNVIADQAITNSGLDATDERDADEIQHILEKIQEKYDSEMGGIMQKVTEVFFMHKPGSDMQGFNIPGDIIFRMETGAEVTITADRMAKQICPKCGELSTDMVGLYGEDNRQCRKCWEQNS